MENTKTMKSPYLMIKNLLKKNYDKEYNDDLTRKDIVKINTKDIKKPAVAVENVEDVIHYICDNINRSIKLTTFLKKELTQLFGKHNTTFRGEFFYYVWIVEFDGETFNIFTANRKGTQFSIVAKYDENNLKSKTRVCINFLRKIEKMLDEIDSNFSKTYFFDCWNRNGKLKTVEIIATNEKDATILFKGKYPDLAFDEPYC